VAAVITSVMTAALVAQVHGGSGKKAALGKIQGAVDPRNFPKARILPSDRSLIALVRKLLLETVSVLLHQAT
jgi:hypothetical protein